MDYMKDIREISDEQAVILWQASRLSLSGKYEKAPEILSVKGSVIGTLGNFSASIGKAKSKKTLMCRLSWLPWNEQSFPESHPFVVPGKLRTFAHGLSAYTS